MSHQAENEVVDFAGIPELIVIPKNCDLKTEMKMKKDNQAREALLQLKLEEEKNLRKTVVTAV